ncbi:MAG TPA: hypothetical protein VK752_00485 [Bryobacteraceae bacterium]|nr:hypothetical protein [Bryobacteraceae bacterium]
MSTSPGPSFNLVESDLLACAARGDTFDAKGASIAAAFLTDLCSGRLEARIHPHGVRVHNAEIAGIIDLEGTACPHPIYLTGSKIPDGIRIQDATLRTVVLNGSTVGPIEGRRVTVNGVFVLSQCRLRKVTLHDARIQGSLSAEGARLRCTEEFGFAADRLVVTGTLFLRNGFRCSSGISVIDCSITGSFDLSGSILRKSTGLALRGVRADVGGSVSFRRTRVRGEIQFTAAEIGGLLEFSNARLQNSGGKTLLMNGARVGQALLFLERFVSRGELSLSFSEVGATVEFDGALLSQKPSTDPAQPPPRCLSAHQLHTKSTFSVTETICVGQIELSSARIDGYLRFRRSSLIDPRRCIAGTPSDILLANGVIVLGDARFTDCWFDGTILLSQAVLSLSLQFEGGGIVEDLALLGYDATVKGGLSFVRGFRAKGAIRMRRVVVHGPVELVACFITRLDLEGAKADGGLSAEGGVSMSAGLHLAGAEIGGLLKFNQGKIEGGVDCARAICKAGLELTERFECQGVFALAAARVTGYLMADGATITVTRDTAIRGNGLQVQGNASFKGANITGTVRLRNADLSGDLDFSGAKIHALDGKAMRVTASTIKGSLFLRNGFVANGGVRLSRARISGGLDFDGAAIVSSNPDVLAIEAHGLEVQGAMIFRDIQQPSLGTISFNHARVGRLEDDRQSWQAFQYRINGFEFRACEQLRAAVVETIRSTPPMTLGQRIEWLRDQPDWSVEPYEHIARIFRGAGYEEEAQKVLIEKHRQLRKQGRLSRLASLKNWLLDYLLGFGYRTWRPLIPMMVMLAVGSWVFEKAFDAQVLVPKDKAPSTTEFNRYAYSVDAFVPLINLKQREAFIYVAAPSGSPAPATWFQGYFWFHTALGWILTTLAAAGLTGLVKKE